jgi:hypothetical protein
MTKDEALKLALEALESSRVFVTTREKIKHPEGTEWYDQAITAIREVLALSESSTKCEETSHAQPDVDRRSTESKETFDQQEPVAITITGKLGNIYSFTGDYSLKKGDKVYTTPPPQYKEPEQEPFCWCIDSKDSADWCFAITKEGVISNSMFMDDQYGKSDPFPLYTTPPQRKPLTDEEMFKIWVRVPAETEDRFAFARAIEAAHGIKGEE